MAAVYLGLGVFGVGLVLVAVFFTREGIRNVRRVAIIHADRESARTLQLGLAWMFAGGVIAIAPALTELLVGK